MLIDTHAHYDHYRFGKNRDEVLAAVRECGIAAVLNPAIEFESNFAMYQKLQDYPWISFAVGIHPKCVRAWDPALDAVWLDGLRSCLEHLPRILAVGELGLDYYHKPASEVAERQAFWFCRQLDLAREFQKPLVLHIRDADEDGLAILRDYPLKESGVVHCYRSDWHTAEQYLELGLYFGIGGAVTHENETALREALVHIPLERIVLETDAPFVKPASWNAVNNSSLSLPQILRTIAELKGISEAEAAHATTENAQRLFGFSENLIDKNA